jgi:hypothetical protein
MENGSCSLAGAAKYDINIIFPIRTPFSFDKLFGIGAKSICCRTSNLVTTSTIGIVLLYSVNDKFIALDISLITLGIS